MLLEITKASPLTDISDASVQIRLSAAESVMCFLRFHQTHIFRHLIPGATFERSARFFLLPVPLPQAQVHAAPLLEKEGNLGPQTLISNISDPFLHHRPGART